MPIVWLDEKAREAFERRHEITEPPEIEGETPTPADTDEAAPSASGSKSKSSKSK